ncbi:MAG: hypothetical protein EBS50_09945 [Sphingomonadaceae bacterium]|nr:hypothetical protein [Sphingomonadaceae bacterium]NBU79372.1 hypothetical protein [Sphingomonadaceae bacterium]
MAAEGNRAKGLDSISELGNPIDFGPTQRSKCDDAFNLDLVATKAAMAIVSGNRCSATDKFYLNKMISRPWLKRIWR